MPAAYKRLKFKTCVTAAPLGYTVSTLNVATKAATTNYHIPLRPLFLTAQRSKTEPNLVDFYAKKTLWKRKICLFFPSKS